MEYYPNGNLDDMMRNNRDIINFEDNTELVDKIIKSTCHGLIELYDNGIMHGNLKPTNILFNNEMKLYLSDYCYFFVDILQSRPDYFMSPEKMLQNQVGTKTDIWSFGNIIYYILTGSPIFHQINSIIAKNNDYNRIENIIEENIPDEVKYKELLLKMLHYDPSDRITIYEVKEILDHF